MKGKDIFLGLKYIGDDLVEKAESGKFRDRERKRDSRPSIRRPLLVAAVIALSLMLVGCGVVYLLKIQDLKIAQSTETRDYALENGVYVSQPHEVNVTTLSLAGVKDTSAYQASQEYYAFQKEFEETVHMMSEEGTLPENFWEEDTYLKTLQAQAQTLAQKYQLKPEGEKLAFRTTRNLCDALGVERFVRDSQELKAYVQSGWCNENGNFRLDMTFAFPEDKGYEVVSTSGILRWNWLDSFSADFVSVVDSGDWVEKNYTTADGHDVLILHSPSQERGFIFCNRGNALMSLAVTMNPEILSEDQGVVSSQLLHMTEAQMEQIADSLDFAVNPRIPTQEDVAAQAAPPQEATQNGYTVTLKSVQTDGYVLKALLGITAPEGVALPESNLITANHDILIGEHPSAGGNVRYETLDDGDGKANTMDAEFQFMETLADGTAPFVKGSTWQLHLVDLVHPEWDSESSTLKEEVLAEGEWTFSITFDDSNGDYRELELITQPIQAKASAGWREDGSDVAETYTLTSCKLRKFSWCIVSDAPDYADFSMINGNSVYILKKDGTKVETLGDQLLEPLDLSQVDSLVLADGTKLEASGTP